MWPVLHSGFINLHSYQDWMSFSCFLFLSILRSLFCQCWVEWNCIVLFHFLERHLIIFAIWIHFVVRFWFFFFSKCLPPIFLWSFLPFSYLFVEIHSIFEIISTLLNKHARDLFFHRFSCIFFLSDELKSFILI